MVDERALPDGSDHIVRPRVNSEYARQWLRQHILAGGIAPGTRLQQADIAARLHISTTPVREALRDLAREGLVSHVPHRGAVVEQLTIEKAKEIYEVRILLDPVLAANAMCMLSESKIKKASKLQQQMDTDVSITEWVEMNRTFHSILNSPCENTELGRIAGQLRERATPWVAMSLDTPERRLASNKEHGHMIKCIQRGDKKALKTHTVQHLESTLRIITIQESTAHGSMDANDEKAAG